MSSFAKGRYSKTRNGRFIAIHNAVLYNDCNNKLSMQATIMPETTDTFRPTRRPSSSSLPDAQQNETFHLAALQEAVEAGWLPSNKAEESCNEDLEWRQAREHAEQELYAKLQNVEHTVDQVNDRLVEVRSLIGEMLGK